MGGGKHNKGCCGPGCTDFCMPAGGSLCPIESTRRYVAQPQEGTSYLGTGDPCCPDLFDWLHGSGGEWENRSFGMVNNDDDTDCIWLTEEFECDEGTSIATLEITTGPEATLTVTLGSYTLVWTADTGYDPLCISSFTYDAFESTPPTECSWPEKFCVIPSESCCADYGYPTTLYATVTVTRFPGGCAAWTSGVAVIELTRITPNDPTYYPGGITAVRWEGGGELWSGGSVLDIVLTCVSSGGGSYRMFMDFPISGCAPDSQDADEDVSTCDPFIFHWTDVGNIGACCTGGVEFDIVVSE